MIAVAILLPRLALFLRGRTSPQYRNSLIHKQRTKSLFGSNTMVTFTGECGNVPESKRALYQSMLLLANDNCAFR